VRIQSKQSANRRNANGVSQVITAETEILSMVNAETAAWNSLDADALVSLFHPDTVCHGHQMLTRTIPWNGSFRTVDLTANAGNDRGKASLMLTIWYITIEKRFVS
jgi:hypothetical protein